MPCSNQFFLRNYLTNYLFELVLWDIDYSYSLGAEVGYDFERVTLRAGYKDVDEEFYDNDAFYVGVAVRFD
ncbi:hypothetical protein [Aliivibrio fischeri]|uniref:hypothetical protein n=1 Tax=Aliivibrio fischeri TaxID=668 RepID=UPI001111E97C|nr:hypothetical protein [Aliivibrio fischeri]MUH97711.1 hypothetical protein [Aliivibrio fischeri]MUI62386.1 hypothetical protein [Aliivibrio fischeri]GGK46844.1 hypothetical protein GCM10007987_32610 [Aliivibrio fischeri]